jgi:hypothetical protein
MPTLFISYLTPLNGTSPRALRAAHIYACVYVRPPERRSNGVPGGQFFLNKGDAKC